MGSNYSSMFQANIHLRTPRPKISLQKQKHIFYTIEGYFLELPPAVAACSLHSQRFCFVCLITMLNKENQQTFPLTQQKE